MRPCPSYPGYSATTDGRVISHRRRGFRTGPFRGGSESRIDPSHTYELSQFTTKKGYKTVGISFPNGKSRPVGVHQLVADAFLGPCPEGLQVRHLNGVPSDNRPDNLRYGTHHDNARDRQVHGTYLGGSNHHNAKLTAGQASTIRRRRRLGEKVLDLAVEYGVSVSTIESIIYGKSYRSSSVEFRRIEEAAHA